MLNSLNRSPRNLLSNWIIFDTILRREFDSDADGEFLTEKFHQMLKIRHGDKNLRTI